MKKIKYLFTILIAAILVGCANDVQGGSEENKNYFSYGASWEFSTSVKSNNQTSQLKYYVYDYQTIDQENNTVTCSAYLDYPKPTSSSQLTKIDIVIIDCHGTISNDSEAPSYTTGGSFIGNTLKENISTINALVISPDYLGYGTSKEKTHPYMITNLCARNIIDAVVPVLQDTSKFGFELNPGYKSFVIGYSQGGQTSLGTFRAVENYIPQEYKSLINLKKCYSGAGPHDLPATMDSFLNKGPDGNGLVFPNLIYMVIKGILSGNYNCMQGYELEDFFTDKFLQSNIRKGLDDKLINLVSLKDEFMQFQDLDELITADLQNPNSKLYKDLKKALSLNSLASGWTVTKPVYIYQHKDDDMVPPINIEKVKEGIGKNNNLVTCFTAEHDTGKDPNNLFEFIHSKAAEDFYLKSGTDLLIFLMQQ